MKQDVTGRVVQRASAMVASIREKLDQAVPLGPTKVEVTPKELRSRYGSMTPDERIAFAASQGGIENAMEMLNGNLP